jgi:hypothetical protein
MLPDAERKKKLPKQRLQEMVVSEHPCCLLALIPKRVDWRKMRDKG